MQWYRVYHLDASGRIESARDVQAIDDAAAIEDARRGFAAAAAPGFELWQGRRLVHKEARAPAE
ncbi:MAG TPA: hypothetical protein VFA22_00570 [Stellaceae bacterium]|nr:hypothetical protein [Stellaceae bacterium]